jgi:NADPH2:quinone reductase
MVLTRAKVKPGECVLVHGIGGGAALAALQWARLVGAEVIVTSSSDEKLARTRTLGAHHTVNYKSENVVDRVRHITSGRGVDVAVDSVGAVTWPLDFGCVRRGGRIVTCGVTTGPRAETNLQALYWNQLTILGSTMGSAEDFRQMLRAVHVNEMRPVTDEVFPLARAPDAMERMEAGRQFGKITLKVGAWASRGPNSQNSRSASDI